MIFHDSFMACRSFRREFFLSYYFEKRFLFCTFVHSTEVLERSVVWGQRQTALRLLWRKWWPRQVVRALEHPCTHACGHAFSRVVLHAHTQLSRSPLHPSLFLSLTHTIYAYFETNGKTMPASYMLHAANTENVLLLFEKENYSEKSFLCKTNNFEGGDF